MKFFEDYQVGDKTEFGLHTFTADEIKRFAQQFDPQPFHLDESAGAASHFGDLVASGWHTASMWMKMQADHMRIEEEKAIAAGLPIPERGPSPGFRDLRWLKPVFPGDTITFAGEIVETRPVRSRPEWGLIFSYNTGTNQRGELVYSFRGSGFIRRRG